MFLQIYPNMKCTVHVRFFAWTLLLMMQTAFLFGQTATNTATAKQKQGIPLIERELFFDNPEIAGGQLSPDGKMISFLKANKGILNVWVKKTNEPFSKAHPITASEEPLGGYFWTYDSKYILFAHAKGGNENYNIYAVDPKDPIDTLTGVPVARNLTPMDTVRATIYNVSKKNPDILWIGLNNRDARWHDLYKLEISTGKLTLLRKNEDRFSAVYFDWDENLRLATRSAEDGSTEILRMNADGSSTKIYDCSTLESCSPDGFTNDNQWFYLETNKGADQDLAKLILMNPETLETKEVEQDPLNKVDFGSLVISEVTREPIYTSYTDSKTRIYWKDTSYEADYKLLQKKFLGREINFNSNTADEQKYLITISSDNKLPEVYFFDRKTKELIFQYTPRPKLKKYEAYFGKMEAIVYPSSDGLEIPAYLSLPKGVSPKNLPLLVIPHGGPWARDGWGFSGFAQWLTNRGYAVLQMNFRGSTGYGKKFLNAGNKQWGMLMQDDITWGVKYLVDKGIADPKRIGIMGGSYGGYATLAGLTFTPDVYAVGVDIVGPSNLITLLGSIPPYWEAARKIFLERMGDPSTVEGKALLEKQSPLFSAANIKAPLLIMQGMNDPRVKKVESDQIVIALRDLGRHVEYICAPDEGHGFAKPVNNLAAFGKAEVFLGEILHARYQESMKPAASKRLKEITVDVATVSLAKRIVVTPLTALPAPSSDLNPGTMNYNLMVEISTQKIPLAMSRSIKEDGGNWVVTDKVTSRMGNQDDEAVYQKGSLQPVSRKASQGNMAVSYGFNAKEVSTTISGKTNTVTVDGAYLHDGAGIDLVIARWPLAEGYEAGFYMIGQDGKAKLYQVKVTGKDSANGVECLKVELTNTEDPKTVLQMWIDPIDKMAYRIVVPLTVLPGAKMTMDLKK
jgi:dipeptidyl aminopeptidase/acylaminoacyl peptidase